MSVENYSAQPKKPIKPLRSTSKPIAFFKMLPRSRTPGLSSSAPMFKRCSLPTNHKYEGRTFRPSFLLFGLWSERSSGEERERHGAISPDRELIGRSSSLRQLIELRRVDIKRILSRAVGHEEVQRGRVLRSHHRLGDKLDDGFSVFWGVRSSGDRELFRRGCCW